MWAQRPEVDGEVWRIEAHERDFSPGPKELAFGPLAQGEILCFSARAVRSITTDRHKEIIDIRYKDRDKAFHIVALEQGLVHLLIASSTDVKLMKVSVLPEGQLPPHAKTVIELSVGESWEGISTMGVKEVVIGVESKLSLKNATPDDKGVFVLEALEEGLTSVVFHSDVGESKTIWFSILGDGKRTTSRTVQPGSK